MQEIESALDLTFEQLIGSAEKFEVAVDYNHRRVENAAGELIGFRGTTPSYTATLTLRLSKNDFVRIVEKPSVDSEKVVSQDTQ